MSARGRRPLLLLTALFAAALLASAPLHAYSGIGRAAVERAVIDVPQTPDELDKRIDSLEAAASAGDHSAATAYAIGVLKLNRPRSMELDDPRHQIAQAVALDPGYRDALELWIDLIPSEGELREMETRLRTSTHLESSAASWDWALARVLHLLEHYPEAEAALTSAEAHDPAFHGRASWLRSVMAGERKNEEECTRRYLEALDSTNDDEVTGDLLWRSAVWLAGADELEAHKTGMSSDRRDFYLAFWKHRDVFPLTEVNERLGEHWRRLKRARSLYAAHSNAYAYFTTHDIFKEHSPDLPNYSSDVVFDYQSRMSTWLDHRGFIYIRHGDPDRFSRASDSARAETWLYTNWSFKPLMFHFVQRRGVGEFVLTLNLAQAMANTSIEDDPKQILQNTADFRDLYGTRSSFHGLFQRVAVARSRYELEDLLVQEAQMMAAFLREAWYDDTNNLLKKDDLLPFSAFSANFREDDGSVAAYVYYAIPEKELKVPGPEFQFDATLVLFSSNWSQKIATTDHHFQYDRPEGRRPGKKDLLVGGLQLNKLKPGRYNFAFQVTERKTGKIGIARGRFVADYFGPGWVNLSEPLIAERITPTDRDSVFERNGQRVVPNPTRTLTRDHPAEVYFEIYDLAAGEDGKNHYRLETRVLQIQEEASFLEKALGFGLDIAGLFFPYPIFLARAGLYGLSVAGNEANHGLDLKVEERTASADQPVVSESFKIDTKKYPAGVYQAYVTVKDYVSGSVNTRSIRFAVTN